MVVVVVDMTCVVGHRNLPYKANLKISLISDPKYLELDLGRNIRVVVCTKLHICVGAMRTSSSETSSVSLIRIKDRERLTQGT